MTNFLSFGYQLNDVTIRYNNYSGMKRGYLS